MSLIKRRSCRAVLLTPQKETLLIKIGSANGDWNGWITPGGGIEIGESEEIALKRELFEELGLSEFDLGPQIWKRFHRFTWNHDTIEQEEAFYLIAIDRFTPITKNLQAAEMAEINGIRWWTIDELKSSSEQFAPRTLYSSLIELIKNGPPSTPIDIGV